MPKALGKMAIQPFIIELIYLVDQTGVGGRKGKKTQQT